MLVLTRKLNETVNIENLCTVRVLRIENGNRIVLGFEAEKDILILRGEVVRKEMPKDGIKDVG